MMAHHFSRFPERLTDGVRTVRCDQPLLILCRGYGCGRIFSRSPAPIETRLLSLRLGMDFFLLDWCRNWLRKLLTKRRKLSGVWIGWLCRLADLTKSEWDIFCILQRYYVCRIVITSLHNCILTKRSQACRTRSVFLRLPKSVGLGLWLSKRDYANVSYRLKVVSASSVLGLCHPDDRSFMCGLFYKKGWGSVCDFLVWVGFLWVKN